MVDRSALRLSSVLLIVGLLLTIIVGLLHPGQENPNNHPAVFAEYSASADWTAVHMGQFLAFAVLAVALFVLYSALNLQAGLAGWANRLAAIFTGVTLGLYAVLQAVDGVVLKRVVDAWVSAPAEQNAGRYAVAEAVRWMEEGTRSYYDVMLGLTFILFAIAVIASARVPRSIGYLMGLSGLSYVIQGWVMGMEGFSPTHGLTQLPAYVFLLAWVISLTVNSWRTQKPVAAGIDTAAG